MPTFKITDPDSGRSLRVTGDSPPTQQEIEQLFSQFKIETVDPIEQERQRLAEQLAAEQGPFQSAAIAAGRGLTTIARGLGLAEPEDPATTRAFKALQEQRPISTTIGEVAGEAAPFLLPGGLVAKAATIPGRVAASGLLGAAEGSLIVSGKGGGDVETLKGAGIGGAVAGTLELALPVIGRIGGKIFRNVTGRSPTAPLLNKAGEPTPELLSALDKVGLSFDDLSSEAQRLVDTGGVDDAVSLGRKQFLESQGIVPTRAQVTGGASEFQAQQELAKTSGRVRRALEGQESILSNRFENAVTATGGSANRSDSSAIDFIADRSIDLDKAISNAYSQARELAPTEKIVKTDGLIDAIRGIAGSDSATGGLASATRDILREKGLLAQGKGLKIQGRIDATQAESIRIDMNALFDSLTPFGKKKLAGFKNALDSDVENAIGQDIFQAPRAAKAKFESDLNRAKVNKFDTRKKNIVRDILENKVNPDRFLDDAILSKSIRSQDVEQLKRYLNLDADEAGVAAWNDIRAEAMERIRSLSIKEVAGEPALSRAGIEKALSLFGREKLRVLFSREERKFLNDMLKTSKLREPVRGTALGKGPSAQALKGLSSAVNRIPILNSVFSGAFELISTDVAGRSVLRQPTIAPLRPVSPRISLASAALVPAATSGQEQQQ